MTGGQLLLDTLLALQQPVHRLIEIILAGILNPQLFRQRGGVPLAGRGQFRRGGDQSLGDHGDNQIPFAAALGRDHGLQVEFTDHRQDSFHMAVGRGVSGSEQILWGDQGLAAQGAAQGFDPWLWPIGEIGQGALQGFLSLPPAFTEEDSRSGVTVGDGFDVHGSYYNNNNRYVKEIVYTYMGTFSPLHFPQLVHNQRLEPDFRTVCRRNFGLGRHGGQKCGILPHTCLELHVGVSAFERGSGAWRAAEITVKCSLPRAPPGQLPSGAFDRELPDNFYFPQANLLITPNVPLRQRKLYGHLTPRTVSVQETICSPGRPQ